MSASSDSQQSLSTESPLKFDPVAAANEYLYAYKPGMTIFDRFKDITTPGGSRMLKKIKESYTVLTSSEGAARGTTDSLFCLSIGPLSVVLVSG
jgi:hypothetical protein